MEHRSEISGVPATSSLEISERIVSALLFRPNDAVRISQLIENIKLESTVLTRIRLAVEAELDNGSYLGVDSLGESLSYIAEKIGPEVLQATLDSLVDLDSEYHPEKLCNQIARISQFDIVHRSLEDAHNAVSQRFDPEGAIRIFQSAVSSTLSTFSEKSSDVAFTPEIVHGMIEKIKSGENRRTVPIGMGLIESHGGDVARKEILTLLGPTNVGKSFFLVNGGVNSLEAGYRVLHVTLEMSAERVFERYLRSLSRVSEGSPEFAYIDGSAIKSSTLDSRKLENLGDDETKRLCDAVSDRLTIIDRPEYSFSAEDLEFELESAEAEGRLPDLLIIDSPNLMKMSRGMDLRLALSEVTRRIRSMCKRFNIAGITVTQANRDAEKGNKITLANVSESYDSASVYDAILGYSQTEIQSLNNLATISVLKSRSTKRHSTFVISQCYEMSLFCVRACLCNGHLEDIMESFTQVLSGETIPHEENIETVSDRTVDKRVEERQTQVIRKTFKAF